MGAVRLEVEKDLKMTLKATQNSAYIVILKIKCHKKDQLQVKN